MGGVKYEDILERYLKALKDDERELLFTFLEGLSDGAAQLVIDTGKQFHKSSAVNGTWFWRIVPVMAEYLPPHDFDSWIEEGTGFCRGSWECALSFLKVSPEVVKSVDSETFLNWVLIGRNLIRFSNHDTNWYFKNSGDILAKLEKQQQVLLISWILKIMEFSWKTAVACMKSWPEISKALAMDNEETILQLGLKLAETMADDADAFFQAAPKLLQKVGDSIIESWVEAAFFVRNGKRGVASSYFGATPDLVEKIEIEDFREKTKQWVLWGDRLAVIDSKISEVFFENTSQVLKHIEWQEIEKWVELIELVVRAYSVQGAFEFVKNAPELLQQLDMGEIAEWTEYGLNSIKGGKRFAYFTLKSQESRDAISRMRTGLHLETVKKVLLLYCEGLTGETVFIRNSSELPSKIHDDEKLFATLDTRRIYLPDIIKEYEEDHDNLRLYRVMMMHQIAHREFGTFDLSREVFAELAGSTTLGMLFEYLEDIRVEHLAMNNYPGLHKDIRILLQRDLVTDSEAIAHPNIHTYLKYFLWRETANFEKPAGFENIPFYNEISEFWRTIEQTGGTSSDSLALARKIMQMDIIDKTDEKHLLKHRNLRYRGRLKYDLIYTAMKLDAEIADDPNHSPETDHVPTESTLNLHSDFYLWLMNLLGKFIEDEENPYRMIAYYDEWDRTLNDYKKDWCRVREILLKPSTARIVVSTMEEHRGMINTLKRYFGMLRPDRFRKYGRQQDGEDIDIDAVIDAMVEKQAGVSPSGGFYIRRDKRERDVAVGFLLDLSYSTEEVVDSSGKTLLDVETESVIVMAEALEVLGDKYAIYGFNSDNRDKINFYVVKDFEEAYSGEVKQRFGGLQSYGMTRVAAAIRHAVFKMEKVQAAIKILILLSDGRPFDFDYNSGLTKDHEEFYAEMDTRVALREAKMRGVNPFCITVDHKGKDYLDYIFGNVSYIIIDDVTMLPTKLTETYKNLTT